MIFKADNMKSKRLKFLLIMIIAVMGSLGLTACNDKDNSSDTTLIAEYVADNGLSYAIYDNGQNKTAVVTAYSKVGSELSVNVPDTVKYNGEDYTVTEIANLAFLRCDIDIIRIGESVKKVGSFAFAYSDVLQTVEFGGSVSSIGDYACINCKNLREIKVKASVPPALGKNAFMYYMDECGYKPNSVLHITVNEGYEEAYKTSSGWQPYALSIYKR